MPIVYTYVYIQATKTCFFTSQPIGVLRPPTTQKLDLLDQHGYIHWPHSRDGAGPGFPRRFTYNHAHAIQHVLAFEQRFF